MSRSIRQHFVPKAYLKQFAFTQEGQKIQRVYGLIKQNQKIVPLPIQVVASRETFYDFGPNDQEQVVEKHLAQNIEGDFANLLRELVSDLKRRETITEEQKRRLAPYLALQYVRTAEFRAALQENLTAVRDTSVRQWRSLFPNSSISEDSVNVGGEMHAALGMNDKVIRTIASILVQHSWRILRAPQTRSFLTSDVPVMLVGESAAPWMGVGFGSYGAFVLFPLSPEFLILTQDYRSFIDRGHQGVNTSIPCTGEMVDQLNGMILGLSAEQAIGRDRNELERAQEWLAQQAQRRH